MLSDIILNPIVQVILSIIIIIIILKVGVPFFFKELKSLESDSNAFKTISNDYTVNIIDGIMPFTSSEVYITTTNKLDDNYVNIPRSINRSSGAQFSFSFWINKGKDFKPESLSDRVILIYGLKNKDTIAKKLPVDLDSLSIDTTFYTDLPYKTILESKIEGEPIDVTPAAIAGSDKNYRSFNISAKTDIIVKCPLIKFSKNGKDIEVEVNTIKNISNSFKISSPLMDIMSKDEWNLLTFTFEDYNNLVGFATGTKMTFYLNNKQVSTQIIKNDSLKINNGKIYILPDTGSVQSVSNSGSIANVTYYNKALKLDEINTILNNRFTEQSYKTPKTKNTKLVAAKYGRISLFDETMGL